MSAQPQDHRPAHPAFCDRDHVPGAQHSSAIEGDGWVIEVLDGSGDRPAGLQPMTAPVLPAFDAIALATSLITVADVLTGRPTGRGVITGDAKRDDVVTIPAAWIDPRRGQIEGDWVDLDIYTPEAAYGRGVELLALAGGEWGWEHYNASDVPCLALRDALPRRGYGAWVGDGLSDSMQRRIETRVSERARRMTVNGPHWPVVLWGSITGDPVAAAVGQVPWTWREDWGFTPAAVPPGSLDGLTGAQIDELTETARQMFLSAPRAVPPPWAVGLPDLEGNRLSVPVEVPYRTREGDRPIRVQVRWSQTNPAESLIVLGHLTLSSDGALYLDRDEARSLMAVISEHADLIEGGEAR